MSLDDILKRIAADSDNRDITYLRQLVQALRPERAADTEQATDSIHALCFVLTSHPEYARALRHYLSQVVITRKLVHLLTDTGITQFDGFWNALAGRISRKFLPALINDDYLKDMLSQLFDKSRDHLWVCGVSDEVWADLLQSLGFRLRKSRQIHAVLTQEILSAIQVLSYRITTIGLESELVRSEPSIERFESPFLRQNDEINHYVAQYSLWLQDKRTEREDGRHIEILLLQCEDIVAKIRRNSHRQGISISLTRLLLIVTQSIQRLRTLLALLDTRQAEYRRPITITLFKELVLADQQKNSVRELIRSNTELLSLQMTERAGRSGEHYVASNRAEWLGMLRSATGAGFIVGFMAMIKILFSKLILAPFAYAFVYSLNYSMGFILVHVLHFTIATKQPAMTAALIAKTIDQGKEKLDDLVELVVRVLRSQFIAIVGNVALAVPTAYAIAWAWYGIYGSHLVSADKAQHLLHDLDPVHSLALPHAAIAGVCLFLSGLISGYYDNKATYGNIPERLRQLNWLKRLLGEPRLYRITNYIGDNLGALSGNFFFGIMLGTIGQLGVFFGLPVDIRHITFSSANLAFALVGLDHHMSWQLALTSITGVLLIGLVNLAVSFSLALLVALRSRRVSFGRGTTLMGLVWRRFISGSRDFFLPPKETVTALEQKDEA